jgi:hypothetical protein
MDRSELHAWNSPDLWRRDYGDMTDGCVFFAEDALGGQFCTRSGRIHTFDPETGAIEDFAEDFEGWAHKILAETGLWTAHSLLRDWEEAHGRLPKGRRLCPIKPFVIGGDFDVRNLMALDAVEGMRLRGDIALQIRGVPDGVQVVVKTVRGEGQT